MLGILFFICSTVSKKIPKEFKDRKYMIRTVFLKDHFVFRLENRLERNRSRCEEII